MTTRRLPTVALAIALLAGTGPALAQTRHVPDPAGDGLKGRALDITDMKVANRDHAVVATISFVRVPKYGDLGFALQQRGDTHHQILAAVYSDHTPRRDENRFASVPHRRTCGRLVVTWDATADAVRIRIPARCINHADYGAVRAQVITEIGSDADFAPKGPKGRWRWSRWISRS
jgi:hypothetical protein